MQFHDCCRALAADQRFDMSSPSFECSALLRFIVRTVVNSGDTGLVATNVVQDCFDDMRRDAELGHPRCHRAAQIMNPPVRKLMTCRPDASIESGLADTPTRKRFCVLPAKHEGVVMLAAIEEGAHSWCDRNAMLAAILGSLRGQYNSIAGNLGPAQRADFIGALSSQDQ